MQLPTRDSNPGHQDIHNAMEANAFTDKNNQYMPKL